MTVDQFEVFVQQQQPASVPWQPVTDYSFEARKAIEGIHPNLIKDVFQPACVLDVGCGYGTLIRLLIELDVIVCGMDTSDHGDEWVGDITKLETCPPYKYDLVICREVLEHLTVLQIRQAVRNLCRLSSKFCYVTTRFCHEHKYEWTDDMYARHLPLGHALLQVQDHDDLDPTHITMLTQDFLRMLFVLEGAKRRADLEAKMDHMHKGRVLVYEVA